MKVIKFSENRGILLKRNTKKVTQQDGEFLNFLWPLMTAGLPLMKSVLTPLAKRVLILLGLSAGMSAADVAIQKKTYGLGTTALIISNEETEDIMKIAKSLKESGLLIKGINETIKNETKEQKGGFHPILLRTIAANILGNSLTGKGVIRLDEGVIRTGHFLIPPHPLTNFEVQKYYQNEPKFNGAYSRNNLSQIKDGTYILDLDEYESIETHWIALYVNADSFGVEHVPKEIRKYTENKSIITNIYRIQAYDSIMSGCFSIGFIDLMLKGKSLLEYANLFSPNEYKKNDKIILKYFQ